MSQPVSSARSLFFVNKGQLSHLWQVTHAPLPAAQTLVLAAGAKGKRYSMKNTRIMVNQPIGGCQGSAIDVNIQAAEQNRNLKLTVEVLERVTGLPRQTIEEAVDRELFLSARGAAPPAHARPRTRARADALCRRAPQERRLTPPQQPRPRMLARSAGAGD